MLRAKALGDPDVLVTSEAPDSAAGPGQVVVEVPLVDIRFLEAMTRRRRVASV